MLWISDENIEWSNFDSKISITATLVNSAICKKSLYWGEEMYFSTFGNIPFVLVCFLKVIQGPGLVVISPENNSSNQ